MPLPGVEMNDQPLLGVRFDPDKTAIKMIRARELGRININVIEGSDFACTCLSIKGFDGSLAAINGTFQVSGDNDSHSVEHGLGSFNSFPLVKGEKLTIVAVTSINSGA